MHDNCPVPLASSSLPRNLNRDNALLVFEIKVDIRVYEGWGLEFWRIVCEKLRKLNEADALRANFGNH